MEPCSHPFPRPALLRLLPRVPVVYVAVHSSCWISLNSSKVSHPGYLWSLCGKEKGKEKEMSRGLLTSKAADREGEQAVGPRAAASFDITAAIQLTPTTYPNDGSSMLFLVNGVVCLACGSSLHLSLHHVLTSSRVKGSVVTTVPVGGPITSIAASGLDWNMTPATVYVAVVMQQPLTPKRSGGGGRATNRGDAGATTTAVTSLVRVFAVSLGASGTSITCREVFEVVDSPFPRVPDYMDPSLSAGSGRKRRRNDAGNDGEEVEGSGEPPAEGSGEPPAKCIEETTAVGINSVLRAQLILDSMEAGGGAGKGLNNGESAADDPRKTTPRLRLVMLTMTRVLVLDLVVSVVPTSGERHSCPYEPRFQLVSQEAGTATAESSTSPQVFRVAESNDLIPPLHHYSVATILALLAEAGADEPSVPGSYCISNVADSCVVGTSNREMLVWGRDQCFDGTTGIEYSIPLAVVSGLLFVPTAITSTRVPSEAILVGGAGVVLEFTVTTTDMAPPSKEDQNDSSVTVGLRLSFEINVHGSSCMDAVRTVAYRPLVDQRQEPAIVVATRSSVVLYERPIGASVVETVLCSTATPEATSALIRQSDSVFGVLCVPLQPVVAAAAVEPVFPGFVNLFRGGRLPMHTWPRVALVVVEGACSGVRGHRGGGIVCVGSIGSGLGNKVITPVSPLAPTVAAAFEQSRARVTQGIISGHVAVKRISTFAFKFSSTLGNSYMRQVGSLVHWFAGLPACIATPSTNWSATTRTAALSQQQQQHSSGQDQETGGMKDDLEAAAVTNSSNNGTPITWIDVIKVELLLIRAVVVVQKDAHRKRAGQPPSPSMEEKRKVECFKRWLIGYAALSRTLVDESIRAEQQQKETSDGGGSTAGAATGTGLQVSSFNKAEIARLPCDLARKFHCPNVLAWIDATVGKLEDPQLTACCAICNAVTPVPPTLQATCPNGHDVVLCARQLTVCSDLSVLSGSQGSQVGPASSPSCSPAQQGQGHSFVFRCLGCRSMTYCSGTSSPPSPFCSMCGNIMMC